MPRYMVERTFTDGLAIPTNDDGAGVCLGVVGNNAEVGRHLGALLRQRRQDQDVLHLRRARAPRRSTRPPSSNGLPVDSVSQVSVLDPYFYH